MRNLTATDRTDRHRVPRWALWTGAAAILVAAIAIFLALFDWNWLRGPVAHEASILSHRPVRIDGRLKVHLLSWTPTASAEGVYIGNPAWAGPGRLAQLGRLTVSVKLLPLLIGQVDLPLLELDQADITAHRDAAGRGNWRSDPNNTTPLKLPPIEHFVLSRSRLRLVDDRKHMLLTGVVASHENQVRPGAPRAGAFELVGQGSLNRAPFDLRISGGPLINVRRDRPYPFDADMRAGTTHVLAHGVLPKPFDFGQVDTALSVSGASFADLNVLTGLALPQTPPFALSAHLARSGKVYHFAGIGGRVGQSDLEGAMTVDDTTGRPDLVADLRSRSLNYHDLGPLIGAPPHGAEVSPQQRAEAAKLKAQSHILPDTSLHLGRATKMDAKVRYSAASVIAPNGPPLRQVKLALFLDHGVMRLDPLSFVLPHGEVSGRIQIDARGRVPRADVDARVVNIRLEDLFKGKAEPPLEGALEARAVLSGVGDSVHQAASDANGSLSIVVPHGEIRRAFAELMGIDAANGLGLIFSKDQSETSLRCVVADFRARDGTLTAGTFVVDTDVVVADGRGEINLGTETLDLTLQGHPKKFRILHLNAPVTVTGHLDSPKFGVKAGAMPLQAVGAAALGVVLGPAAAILPFVDPGLTHNADCAGLVSRAAQRGAPVSPSATTPAKRR